MSTGDASESLSSRDLRGLQNSESLAALFDIAFDAVVAFDNQEKIIYWNPAAEQMYGWRSKEALGKTPAELFRPGSISQEQKHRKQRQLKLRRGETLRGRHNACRKDGSLLRVQYAARAILDTKGKVSGSLVFYRDISAQKQDTKETLRARTEEIDTLLKVSPVAIFVAHDPKCTRISGNPAGYRLVELPETSGANISKSAPVHERPTYRTFRNGIEVPAEDLPMQKAARLGVEVNEDALELRFEDGSQKFIFAYARPLFDSQGRSRGAVAAMLDITDRRRAEEQLERSNQWLYRILDSIQDDFYVIDRDWKFVFTSRSFTSRLGKKPRELIGKDVWESFPKHVGTILKENFRTAMEKGEVRRFEMPGHYTGAWYSLTVFPSPEGITVFGMDITERKLAEKALHESEERYRHLVKYAPAGIYEIDVKTRRFMEVNDIMCQILGYTRQELLSMTPEELLDEEGKERFRERMFHMLAGEAISEETEYKIRTRDGREIWAAFNITINYEAGKPRSVSVIAHDITARKQAEDALRQNEERLRQMIETSLVAIGFGDSTGKIFDANESFYRLTGYSREEIQVSQLGWNHLTAPEYVEIDRQMIATLAATGSAGPYEKEYIRKDGSRVPIMLTMSKLPGRDEHIAFLMDISTRKRTEQALAQALQELYAHIDNSPLAIIVFDAEYRITEWSEGAERMFGWNAEEVANKKIVDLHWMQEEDAQQVMALSANMLAGGASSNVHANRNYRKDGSVIECEWYNSALLDADGKLISVRSQVLDITERKRAQKTLERQSELLQKVFENIPVLLVMWDPHLRQFTLNRHAETVLGWTSADINTGDFMSMTYPDPEYRAEVSAYMQSLASGFRELINVSKDGERIPIEWANIRLADDTMVGIGVDLREHKQAEDALRENQRQLELLNETLEQKVQEKTSEVRHLAAEMIKAVQQERHRISHILHDDLQQRIYAIQMQLTFLHDEFQKEQEAARQEAMDIEKQLAEVLTITRHLSIDLSPPILRDEGLVHAINWLAAQMQQRYDLPIEIQATGSFALENEELHVLLFNCVRELLFNVVKHAQASRAAVTLQWANDNLQIEVHDDGKGFSSNTLERQTNGIMGEEGELQISSGLPTIRHQLNLFGGRMEIRSTLGAGTRIILVIPVVEAE